MALLAGIVRRPGLLSSSALAASGLAIALMPERVGPTLGIPAVSARGIAETRAGLGGTFAALGIWALIRGRADVYTAVGATWLGAATARLISLRVDEPETDASYWAYLAAELTLGLAGLVASGRE